MEIKTIDQKKGHKGIWTLFVISFFMIVGVIEYMGWVNLYAKYSIMCVTVVVVLWIFWKVYSTRQTSWVLYEDRIVYENKLQKKITEIQVSEIEKVRFKKKDTKRKYEIMYMEDSKGNVLYVPKDAVSKEDWDYIINFLGDKGKNIIK